MSLIYRFEASYAGIPLQVVSWTLNRGRSIIQHRPARGNGVQTSDRGQNPRTDQLWHGVPDEALHVIGPAPGGRTGTTVRFWPDPTTLLVLQNVVF